MTEIARADFEQVGFESEKNANWALHTAKSVIVDRILQEMYTSRFDESSRVEGRYTSVQRVKI